MADDSKPKGQAVANGESLKPTPELQRMIRERFPEEGKAERIARSLAALEEIRQLPRIQLTPQQWKVIAEDDDILEQ